MAGRFSEQVFVVTGSTSGIGEAIARMIADEGGTVVIHGYEPDLADSVVESVTQQGGVASSCVGDLRDPDVPRRVVEHCLSHHGRIDGLVNNAGVSTRLSLASTTAALFDEIFAINVRSALLFIQAAEPHFRDNRAGVIVNIGSVNAYAGGEDLLPYSMSKGAMMTMTRNLAPTMAKIGARVNQLNIGWTHTQNEVALGRVGGLGEDWINAEAPKWMPYGVLFSPEDIAKAVCFLLSDDSHLLNGSVIEYDQKPHVG